jgi:hypothetical protein
MPRYGERIWIDPARCTQVVTPIIGHHRSGTVESGAWDVHTRPIESIYKLTACISHFADGVPWADTGVFDHMMEAIADHGETDGCRDLEDVRHRYQQLDRVYEKVRLDGRLRTRFELGAVRRSWSEVGGVFVHVGRDLTPIFGRGGVHRLAISKVVGLERIPAQVGVVHVHAVDRWRDAFGERANTR